MPTLRKLKELQADTQANAFAAHLILPNRTQSPPTIQTKLLTKFIDFFYIGSKYSFKFANICQVKTKHIENTDNRNNTARIKRS